MAKTRGGHSASPSSPTPSTTSSRHGSRSFATCSGPRPFPPSEGEAPSQRRYPHQEATHGPCATTDRPQRPAPRPPAKRTKFSGPGEPSHAPQPEPATEEPQIPVENTPETIIRRPMIAGPPIEGNLDCRDRPFHSETYFDIKALRQQPELRDSFRLLQRVPLELVILLRPSVYLMSPCFRQISGVVLILSKQHGPHFVQGDFYSLEKVHQKKLQRADGIPLLFPRLLCQILEHLGYPEEPRLERRRHCREDFSLDKWHHLVAYFAPQGAPAVHAPPELPRDEQIPQAQQDEILTETPPPAPAAHPQCTCPRLYILPPLSLRVLHQSCQLPQHLLLHLSPTVTISLTEFRGLERSLRTLSTAQDSIIHQMATIRAHQDQIIATQAQHTTILHQIQQHLSMQTPFGHDRSAPSEPLVRDEESLPAEQPIPEEDIRAEPSHDPTHI
ncbi:hypothetical protein CK203_065463 [Vitis vinifera]|uniref:Uncharacterized protein n=1 Tax=Vitis vinifera TaxID=29760 RepID=A0A438G3E6_VITVI|nr:hypothetical protein CK203_065463 [Vitis vinifera]